jgi:hypothetical protein
MSILTVLREIHDPRFSTAEMETGKLKCGFDFKITSMFYDDERPGLPSHAFGYVQPPNSSPLQAVWNRHGECHVNSTRIGSFDLQRTTQDYINSATVVGESILVGFIVIVVCVIF